MKKKVLSLLLVAAMGLTMLVGCGGGSDKDTQAGGNNAGEELNYDGVAIKVWAPDATVAFTEKQIEAWKTANPEMKNVTVTIEAVGEGDVAQKLITDVTAGADVYNFPQDQLARLVATEAIMPIGGDYAKEITNNNDTGSVAAATVGEKVYAFPLTSDNGYFLYYDKSVLTDVTTLEGILAACEKAGKSFYFENNNAWYQAAFFFGAGCEMLYETDDEGAFVGNTITIANDNGVAAVKAMIKMASSKAFVNGSSVGKAANAAAVVSGTWDATDAKALFGDNYACAKLPTFETAKGAVQLGGFGGFKLLGIKPQTDAAKQAACLSLGSFLSSGDVQLARYNEVGWGPSNKAAQASDAVKADAALTALAEQLQYTIPQGQYPSAFWDDVKAMGESINAGEFNNLTDAQILEKLTELEGKLKAAK